MPIRRADRAQLCWTLGITERHNSIDNVLALINLALLCGHVGRHGAGLNPLRGQNNVQGGGDMGAIPNPRRRQASRTSWTPWPGPSSTTRGACRSRRERLDLTEMFEAMERGACEALFAIGENPAE